METMYLYEMGYDIGLRYNTESTKLFIEFCNTVQTLCNANMMFGVHEDLAEKYNTLAEQLIEGLWVSIAEADLQGVEKLCISDGVKDLMVHVIIHINSIL